MGADRITHRDLTWGPAAEGIRVTGTEVFETRRELTFAADLSADRGAVLLVVGGAEYAMPAEAARVLAAGLVAVANLAADKDQRAPLPAGHQGLVDFAVAGIRDAFAVTGKAGSGQFAEAVDAALREAAGKASPANDAGHTARIDGNARRIIDEALARYGGPCSQAYGEVLRAYVGAPAGGRDALFLAMTDRVLGVVRPTRSPSSPAALGGVGPGRSPQELMRWMGQAFARPPRRAGS